MFRFQRNSRYDKRRVESMRINVPVRVEYLVHNNLRKREWYSSAGGWRVGAGADRQMCMTVVCGRHDGHITKLNYCVFYAPIVSSFFLLSLASADVKSICMRDIDNTW